MFLSFEMSASGEKPRAVVAKLYHIPTTKSRGPVLSGLPLVLHKTLIFAVRFDLPHRLSLGRVTLELPNVKK
jgi:hypothetical protein